MKVKGVSQFEEITIPVPWGHLKGRWYGRKDIRPLLALHGWLDNSGTWHILTQHLPSYISVLAIDLSGHGKSSHLPPGMPYSYINYLGEICLIMKYYNWETVSIIAHSLLAEVGFMFAALFPNKVEILIQIDDLHPKIWPIDESIKDFQINIEEYVDKITGDNTVEPPSYTYNEIVDRMHNGSLESLDKDKCHHILIDNTSKSKQYPSKYYFSRDSRIKNFLRYYYSLNQCVEFAKRIRMPLLTIRASDSFIPIDKEIIQVLKDHNPHYEFHEVKGTHHVHLNDPTKVAKFINPFIEKWKSRTSLGKPMNQKPFESTAEGHMGNYNNMAKL